MQYTLSFKDFLATQWLYLKRRKWNMLLCVLMYVLLPVVSIACLIYVLWSNAHTAPEQVVPFPLAIWFLAFYAALTPLMWLLGMALRYKRMLPRKVAKTIEFTFDDREFVSALPGRSEGRFQWNAIEDFAEDRSVAILLINRNMYIPLPKRAFSAQEWDRFRSLVDARPRRL